MKNTVFALGLLALSLGSCNTTTESGSKSDSTALLKSGDASIDTYTSQNSLDYTGTYTGVLPCADCPGIKTEITLHADSSFIKKMTYLERPEAGIFKNQGTYSWDPAGQRITLEGIDAPNQYWVGENTLTQLDMAGEKVAGSLADLYVLKK